MRTKQRDPQEASGHWILKAHTVRTAVLRTTPTVWETVYMCSLLKQICDHTSCVLRNYGRTKPVRNILIFPLLVSVLIFFNFPASSVFVIIGYLYVIGCFMQVSRWCMVAGFIAQRRRSTSPRVNSWRRRCLRATTITACPSARSWGNVLCCL